MKFLMLTLVLAIQLTFGPYGEAAGNADQMVGQDTSGVWCVFLNIDLAQTHAERCRGRILGWVIDAQTGQFIPNVCVALNQDCTTYSDTHSGQWFVDVATGSYSDIRFQAPGYRAGLIRVFIPVSPNDIVGPTVNVGNIRLTR